MSRIGSLSMVRGMRELDPPHGRQLCSPLEDGEQVVSLPVQVMITELKLIRRNSGLRHTDLHNETVTANGRLTGSTARAFRWQSYRGCCAAGFRSSLCPVRVR